jgi:branched-chain amino acid aminotransferase
VSPGSLGPTRHGVGHGPGGGEPVGAVWLDGALVAMADARISPADRGLLVGDGAFETLEVVGGTTPFALTRHLHRLGRSLSRLGLAVPAGGLVREAVAAVIGTATEPVGRLRITVTAGTGATGSARTGGHPTLLVQAGPPSAHPATASVAVVPWPRNERSPMVGIKSLSYGDNVLALDWARQRGAEEAVFANTSGHLCEGASSNLLVEQHGALMTPPLSSGCLPGVTRELLLELGVAVEADLSLGALMAAAEVGITSSTRGVQPVRTVDGQPVPLVPGPLTVASQAAFAALRARTLDP